VADVGTEIKKIIVRPASVIADLVLSCFAGVAAYMLLGLFVGLLPFGEAMQAVLAGIFAAMVYMRARTNLLDPTPAFQVK
jgi:hypothetical protein